MIVKNEILEGKPFNQLENFTDFTVNNLKFTKIPPFTPNLDASLNAYCHDTNDYTHFSGETRTHSWTSSSTPFSDLEYGDVFLNYGRIYMKIVDPCGDFNSICIGSYKTEFYPDDYEVIPTDSILIIKERD